MSLVDGHGSGVGFVVRVECARADDLLVNEGRLARCARALRALVVHLVQAETFSEARKKRCRYSVIIIYAYLELHLFKKVIAFLNT